MADDPTPAVNVVKPDASQYAAGATMPTGWAREGDDPVDKKAYKRRAVYRGVRTSQDAAYAAIKTSYGDNILGLTVTPQGALCEISVEYSASLGTVGPGGDDPNDAPVAPDTYQLRSISIPTALAAHPAFANIDAYVFAIEEAISHGDREGVVEAAGSVAAAQEYAALRLAGVTQWDAPGYSWRVTRHYSTLANLSGITEAASAIVANGTVCAWSAVEGHLKILEPKYVYVDDDGQTSQPQSFAWRLSGVGVSRTDTNLDLTYEYTAAWKWAAALYPGGSWSPALPQSPTP